MVIVVPHLVYSVKFVKLQLKWRLC